MVAPHSPGGTSSGRFFTGSPSDSQVRYVAHHFEESRWRLAWICSKGAFTPLYARRLPKDVGRPTFFPVIQGRRQGKCAPLSTALMNCSVTCFRIVTLLIRIDLVFAVMRSIHIKENKAIGNGGRLSFPSQSLSQPKAGGRLARGEKRWGKMALPSRKQIAV